jgi:hypothetical protein
VPAYLLIHFNRKVSLKQWNYVTSFTRVVTLLTNEQINKGVCLLKKLNICLKSDSYIFYKFLPAIILFIVLLARFYSFFFNGTFNSYKSLKIFPNLATLLGLRNCKLVSNSRCNRIISLRQF